MDANAGPALAPGPHHATPERLLARLDELGIRTTTARHPPLFTVEDSRRLRGDLPGGHCKNLFLKDRKDKLWLVVTLEHRAIDLKTLPDRIGAARLSFGRPELLVDVLGVTPGGVTPFALINDVEQRVSVVLDREMLTFDPLNYHPLSNAMTTAIAPDDLLRFVRACGHVPQIVDLG
ncbi:MAG: prolyl-tRNA synthetase associated domain-containing protein [Alphaproteobacteria bacterium]